MSIDWISRAERVNLGVRNLIGSRRGESRGDIIEKYAPRDGRLLCSFGSGDASDVDEAVSEARRAFEDGRWRAMPIARRKQVMHGLAALVELHKEELALLECLDVGKPITDAIGFDVPAAAATVRFGAEALDKLEGRVFGIDQTSMSIQLQRPMGVVAGVIGWNFPLVLAATKLSPVLATGNSLVLKPSELTSFSAIRLAELALEAGVPEGVINVIHGDYRMGSALAHHSDVDLLTFTGSSQTGKKLLIAAGQSNMKRLVLECGGKSPNIVFDDAPSLDAAAEGVLARAFWNQGEVCTASSRLLVQESIECEFLELLTRKIAAYTVGDPLDPATKFGALVSQGHKAKVLRYIELGEREGARQVYRSGSSAPFESGAYLGPVLFDQVKPTQTIAQEEIFGPVLSVLTFRDEAEALRIANQTKYGLSAIIWTRDIGRAHRLAYGLNAGWIVINATAEPRGGPSSISVGGHKQSGIGTEGSLEGLESYFSKSALQIFS